MRKHTKKFLRKIVAFIVMMLLLLSVTSCGIVKIKLENIKTENIKIEKTAFEKDSDYLVKKGLRLPKLSPTSNMDEEIFYRLLAETYESIGGIIDTSKINPESKSSSAVKKITMIGVYDPMMNFQEDTVDNDLKFETASYLFMKLQDSIQQRLYLRTDSSARVRNLWTRMKVSTVLYTWKLEEDKNNTDIFGGLLANKEELEQSLTRRKTSEMMVTVYEHYCGEIQTDEALRPKDTDDLYAWKANQFFIWLEGENFEPEKTGNWDDWEFMSAMAFDGQLCAGLNLVESKPAYGAIVGALASLLRDVEGIEQNVQEEKIVLNEQSYQWYVYQQETGEYGYVNCMPSCVEMGLRYQGIANPPTAEQLRKEYPLDGWGWNDVLAENVMVQYGLTFASSFDIKLDKMEEYLNKGNILYVMYVDANSPEGHAVIIKGYWKVGDTVEFILSDPNDNTVGIFGYPERIVDALTMMTNMENHVSQYFIIPKGE